MQMVKTNKATAEQIESAKAAIASADPKADTTIQEICATDKEGNQKYCYIRKPNRYIIGEAMVKMATNLVLAMEHIYESCVIEGLGDVNEIRHNDDLFLTVSNSLAAYMNQKKSTSTIY